MCIGSRLCTCVLLSTVHRDIFGTEIKKSARKVLIFKWVE